MGRLRWRQPGLRFLNQSPTDRITKRVSSGTLFLYRFSMMQIFRFPFFHLTLAGPPDLLEQIKLPLSQLCCRQVDEIQESQAGFTMQVTQTPLALADPQTNFAPIFSDDPTRLRRNQDQSIFLATVGNSTAQITPAQGKAILHLDQETFPDLPHWRQRSLLVDILLALLAGYPCFTLHGALLARDGEGLVITGPPGAGKTTMSFSLATAGWSIMTDDNLLFRPTQQASLGSGLRRLIYASEDTCARYPELIARRTGLPNITGTKEAVELRHGDGHDPALIEIPIRKIICLERTDSKTTNWHPLLPRDALPLLWQQVFTILTIGEEKQWFNALTELTRTSTLACVQAGIDLLNDKKTAAGIITEIDRQGGNK